MTTGQIARYKSGQIKSSQHLTHVSVVEESSFEDVSEGSQARVAVPKGVMIYRVFGALFFGAADKLETILHQQHSEPEVLILKMHEVISMDSSALHALTRLHHKLQKSGKHLILCGAHTQPYLLMNQAGFFDVLERSNVTADLDSALLRAEELLKQ